MRNPTLRDEHNRPVQYLGRTYYVVASWTAQPTEHDYRMGRHTVPGVRWVRMMSQAGTQFTIEAEHVPGA